MKLIIRDSGDRSVGIWPTDWVIEVPFEKSDFDGDELRMNLEGFREDMIKAYEPYCECSCGASYDFELEEEARMEEEALREAEEIKVLIRLGTIIESNDAIEYLGLNPWCINEGADPDTTYEIPASKAKEFGFIK